MFSQYKRTIILIIQTYFLLYAVRTNPSILPPDLEWLVLVCALISGLMGYLEFREVPFTSEYTRIQLHFRE